MSSTSRRCQLVVDLMRLGSESEDESEDYSSSSYSGSGSDSESDEQQEDIDLERHQVEVGVEPTLVAPPVIEDEWGNFKKRVKEHWEIGSKFAKKEVRASKHGLEGRTDLRMLPRVAKC